MFSLFNRAHGATASNTLSASSGPCVHPPGNDVARDLLERAEAGAGRDPYRAQQLRDAAKAYLSVVR